MGIVNYFYILQEGVLTTNDKETYSQPDKVDVVGQSTFADIGKKFWL